MKIVRLFFEFLLFPFIFLMNFSLFQKIGIYFHLKRWKINKNLFVLTLLLFIFSPNLYSEGGGDDIPTSISTETQIVENADDLCYEDPEEGGLCISIPFVNCRGGIGCSNKFPLKNIGDSNLSNIEVIYDEDRIGGHAFGNCQIEKSGSCDQVDDYDFGPVGIFDTANKFDFDNDFSPYETGNSIYIEALMSGECMRQEKLYGSYVKDGILHRGKIRPCSERFNCANPKDFTIIKQTNTQGNIKLIGNTNICRPKNNDPSTGECVDPGNATNNSTNAIWRKGDSNTDTVNASAAKLELPDGATILWAGLYWQGYFQLSNSSDLYQAQENSAKIKLGFTTNKGKQEVVYSQLYATRLNHVYFNSSRWYYQGFTDVTDYVKARGAGWYWGADLETTLGKPNGGTLGAWSIAIIYQDENADIKNLTVFDGYLALANNTDVKNAIKYANNHGCDPTKTGVQHETEMTLTGFKTPREGDVSSRLIFFGGEGDIGLTGDNLWLMDKNNTYHKIENSTNPNNNIANSSITDYSVRRDASLLYPYWGYNTIGIDIDTFDVSNIIGNNQTQTKAKMNTVGDGYFPGIFGFSTDLYTPEVCYDYVLKRNEFLLPSNNRIYDISSAQKNDEISFTVAIWDIKGDIDPRYTSIAVDLTQTKGNMSPIRNPDKAYYTLKNGNTLLPTNYADPMSTANRPVITIGKGRDDNTGGTISPDERYYTKFYFKTNTEEGLQGHFKVDVNGTMNYGSGDFWQILDVERCPQSAVYNPDWYQFNVEKVFTPTVPSDDTQHYSLPTRVAGKDFDYSVASYTNDPSNNGKYTKPAAADGVTVDVEMINIDAFDDNSSYFKCGNAEPSIIVMPGKFVYFDNKKERINITDNTDLTDTYAIRSATFRMWMLLDENGTVITDKQFHSKNDNNYFKQIYDTYFKKEDVKGLCTTACSTYNYDSPRYPEYDVHAQGCYACLRDFFAQPYCARDNFAIRPKAIRTVLGDKGKDSNSSSIPIAKNSINLTPDNNVSIAAEYSYELNLTVINENDLKTNGYYAQSYFEGSAEDVISVPTKLEQSAALIKFEDSSNCADQTHKTIQPNFDDGEDSIQLKQRNVGFYSFEIWDSNWTKVDRAYENKYKTVFDDSCKESQDARCNDCVLGKSTNEINTDEKVGCTFSSELTHSDESVNDNYTKLELTLKPYSFDLSSISLHTRPHDGIDWVYMNDLDNNKTMAVTLEGNITAKGAEGSILSNYTDGCAAQDILFKTDYTSLYGAIVDEDNSSVAFEQTIKKIDGTFSDPLASADANITFGKENFASTGDVNGSAEAKIYFNIKKPYDKTVNVADINFTVLDAYGVNDISNADQKPDHRADGNRSIGENIFFFFSKVAPIPGTNGRQIYAPNITTQTALLADTYCISDVTIGLNCDLITEFSGKDEILTGGGWYRTGAHSSILGDGSIISLTSSTSSLSITPSSNIGMDSNGSSGSISISYPTEGRPVHPIIVITPDEWMKYNPNSSKNGLPEFLLHFLNSGIRWKGIGHTGNVVETEPSDVSNQRIGW